MSAVLDFHSFLQEQRWNCLDAKGLLYMMIDGVYAKIFERISAGQRYLELRNVVHVVLLLHHLWHLTSHSHPHPQARLGHVRFVLMRLQIWY